MNPKFTAESLRAPRMVKVLGVEPRLAETDEDIDRGPLTQPAELSQEEWIAADVAANERKGERWHERHDAQAVELQLQQFREGGVL